MRPIAKLTLNALGLLLALPYSAWAWLGARVLGEGPYSTCAFALSLLPGLLGVVVRRAFYCLLLPECAWDLHVGFGSVVTHPTASIGRRVWIGAYCLTGRCTIGDDVVIGSRVSLLSGRRQHRFNRLDAPIRAQSGVLEKLAIGGDSWLGEECIIMADVGAGSVVGAGAVVVHPTASLSVVVGNPARQVATRGPSPESSAHATE
jgi:acetyltransferase-like isoleucine patch superfamily enzyme